MKSYGAARFYFGVLEFLSWCIIILGALVAIGAIMALGQISRNIGGSSMAGLAGLIPGVSLVFAGFFGLVSAQTGRAGVDSAEYGQQSLKITREQLAISKQGLKHDANGGKGFAALAAAKEELRTGENPSKASFAHEKPGKDPAKPESVSYQPGDIIDYRGKVIRVVEAGYVFAGTVYAKLAKAKARVDEEVYALPYEHDNPQPNDDGLSTNNGPTFGGVTRS